MSKLRQRGSFERTTLPLGASHRDDVLELHKIIATGVAAEISQVFPAADRAFLLQTAEPEPRNLAQRKLGPQREKLREKCMAPGLGLQLVLERRLRCQLLKITIRFTMKTTRESFGSRGKSRLRRARGCVLEMNDTTHDLFTFRRCLAS